MKFRATTRRRRQYETFLMNAHQTVSINKESVRIVSICFYIPIACVVYKNETVSAQVRIVATARSHYREQKTFRRTQEL